MSGTGLWGVRGKDHYLEMNDEGEHLYSHHALAHRIDELEMQRLGLAALAASILAMALIATNT